MDNHHKKLIIATGFLVSLCYLQQVNSQGLASKRCEILEVSVAKCTDKFLISAQLDGLPQRLRSLILDRNQISSLENNAFYRTPYLQELSIAFNRLDTIDMNAFEDLTALKQLNLSNNRLETLNEYILDNLSVEVLDLSGNNFMYAEGKLGFNSPSLKELYLSNCKIVSVNGMLKNLQSLQKVDLSKNLLVSLDLPSFIPLTELRYLKLEENHFRCDKPTQYLMDWFRKHSIDYDGPFCAIQRKDMFQRMEMSLDKIGQKDIEDNESLKNSSLAKINASNVEMELVNSLFEKTYFTRCLRMDHELVCHMLENCKNDLNCDKYIEEQQRHNKINFYFILVIFVIGFFIGSVVALCCCQALIYCRMDKKRLRRNRVYETQAYNAVPMRPMGDGQGINPESRVQIPVRESDALVEANGFHDLVNELFSRRRSHRRMISAGIQQGTNLVRQLSRSSLNLLRRQHSRAANANARAAGAPQRPVTPPLYEPVAYSDAVNHPLEYTPEPRERSRSFTYSPDMINSNNNDLLLADLLRQQRRSESPPPTYDLCVSLPKSGNASD